MKYRAVSLALATALLFSAAAGFSGCGRTGNRIVSIAIPQTLPVFAKGSMYQLSVTAQFSDGMTIPQWSQVTWQSSDSTVATVDTSGRITGVKIGTAVITATDIAHPELTSSVTVYITELLSITVSPAAVSIATGTTQIFTATGLFSDLTPSAWSTSTTWPFAEITTMVYWESSNTAVADIRNVSGVQGFATAYSAGTTTITATDLATSVSGTAITGTATLTVF